MMRRSKWEDDVNEGMRAQETYIPTKKKLLDLDKMKKIVNSTSFYTEIQENLEILKLQVQNGKI